MKWFLMIVTVIGAMCLWSAIILLLAVGVQIDKVRRAIRGSKPPW